MSIYKPCFRLLSGCLLLLCLNGTAQPDRSICLGGGAAVGSNVFAEIALIKRVIGDERHYSISFSSLGVEMRPGNRFILAPKLSLWGAAMTNMAIGGSLLRYTDFKQGVTVARPEIGFTNEFMKIVYGYNFRLGRGEQTGVNDHQVSALFYFTLKELKVRKPK